MQLFKITVYSSFGTTNSFFLNLMIVFFFSSMYLSLHVLAVLAIVVLPRAVPIPRNGGAATLKNKLAKLATTNGLATGING